MVEWSKALSVCEGTQVRNLYAAEIFAFDLELGDKSGLRLGFSAEGRIDGVFGAKPELDASLGIAPFDLASLKGELPGVDRIAGVLSGSLRLNGDLAAPKVTGFAKLRGWKSVAPTYRRGSAVLLVSTG